MGRRPPGYRQGRPDIPRQDLPRPLVFHVGGNRPVFVCGAARNRCVPVAVLHSLRPRDRLSRRLSPAPGPKGIRGLCHVGRAFLRREVRPVDAPGPPLVRRHLLGLDRGAYGSGVLHRCVPQASRVQLDRGRDHAVAGHRQWVPGLLPPRRPGIRYRYPDRLFDRRVGTIGGLLAAHLGLLVKQKHTQFKGRGKTEHNVVGSPMFPTFMAKTTGFLFMTTAVTFILAGFAQINPIWQFGQYEPFQISYAVQPDWYMGWLDGTLRIMPSWEFVGWGHTIPLEVLLPAVIFPGIIFQIRLNSVLWFFRIAVPLIPVITYFVTVKICEEMRGAEGIGKRKPPNVVHRSASGEFSTVPAEARPGDGHEELEAVPVPAFIDT